MIDDLWLTCGVGIIGGAPKVCKTYLAAELALAIASGRPALGHFSTRVCGPVLFYGAEDSLPELRVRFDNISTARSIPLDSLPIYLLDTPSLRLDIDHDLQRLRRTIECYTPRLLVLDPFVRLAKIDENSASDVAAVLASLRTLQRLYDLALILVHHARKSPSANLGYALRGSGDFAAWSDSNLLLCRKQHRLTLYLEHRCAPAPAPIHLHLHAAPAPHLVVDELRGPSADRAPIDGAADPLQAEILKRLQASPSPMTTVSIRNVLCKRKQDVVVALDALRQTGRIIRTDKGWQLAPS
jgi:hypothetical protein